MRQIGAGAGRCNRLLVATTEGDYALENDYEFIFVSVVVQRRSESVRCHKFDGRHRASRAGSDLDRGEIVEEVEVLAFVSFEDSDLVRFDRCL